MRWGCSLQKFFPAEAAGGPAFLRALEGPLAHRGVRYIPTGGVTNGNLRGYLGLKSVVAAGGSWMVSPPLVKKGDWDGITELVEEAVQVAALGGAFSKDASPV
jgi:2-dehydro-3-deoxyphosphogluconate aldolase/(4S)-4-hydroxy-2-oxoglutarate aldolase